VAIADYRLYPEVKYPTFLQDNAAAVAWVKNRMATETGTAPNALYFVGHSAGAYNAAMLAFDPRWLAAQGLRVCDTVDAFVGLAGPYDFLPLTGRTLPAIFGLPTPPETMPINHVNGKAPPALLIHGQTDTTVLPRNSQALAARIRAQGGKVEEMSYVNIDHIWLVGAIGTPLRSIAPTLDDVDAFLKKQPRGCGP
jgi:acetyl esterase/lipase